MTPTQPHGGWSCASIAEARDVLKRLNAATMLASSDRAHIRRAVVEAGKNIEAAQSKLAQPRPLRDRIKDAIDWTVGIGGFAAGVADAAPNGMHLTSFGGVGLVLGVVGLWRAAAVYDQREKRLSAQSRRLVRHRTILQSIRRKA